jgi:branched-chain amino acid transport system ATP-binding protein
MTDAALAPANAASGARPLLEIAGLEAWYGESHILHGVDFEVRPGEVVTLLGRNGAGKTTTLKSIMGIVGKRRGSAASPPIASPASASRSARRNAAFLRASTSKKTSCCRRRSPRRAGSAWSASSRCSPT